MPKTVLRKRTRAACIGDLRDRVVIQDRRIAEPNFGAVDFDELFKCEKGRWALVETVIGKVLFAGIGTDVAVTHSVVIRHDPSVSSESWVLLESGNRLDVMSVEDLDERRRFDRLLCVEKGKKTTAASRV